MIISLKLFFDKVISRKTNKCLQTFTFLLTLLSLINGQTGVLIAFVGAQRGRPKMTRATLL